MANLKDLKIRIESVKSTRKITKAMQMVSAAKLRRAQEAAEASRPYAERMNHVISNLTAANAGNASAPKLLSGSGKDETHLLIVATSERGLCGGFNTNIVKKARADISALLNAGKTVKILTIGKKGREQLKRDFSNHMIDHVDLSGVKKIGYEDANQIAQNITTSFDANEFDVATLYFAKFQSVISQTPTAQQLIPVQAPEDSNTSLYEYEPSEEVILGELLPRSIATQIFSALLENSASEQGARMSAMDNATRNAGDMIERLTIEYNRTRQAAITSELIEIISGAEAL